MTLDALRGRGAFRCGCGARVVVSTPDEAPAEHCAWKGCRLAGLRDFDVPLCAEHVRRLKMQLAVNRDAEYRAELFRRSVMDDSDDDIAEFVEKQRAKNAERRLAQDRGYAPWKADPSWVYFMRHDQIIKIGYSKNPRKRAAALASAEILATEPGGVERESELHSRFRAHRLHGEWFTPAPELLDYIDELRAKTGLPSVRTLRRRRTARAARSNSGHA